VCPGDYLCATRLLSVVLGERCQRPSIVVENGGTKKKVQDLIFLSWPVEDDTIRPVQCRVPRASKPGYAHVVADSRTARLGIVVMAPIFCRRLVEEVIFAHLLPHSSGAVVALSHTSQSLATRQRTSAESALILHEGPEANSPITSVARPRGIPALT
jgi:hypothetical protein